MATVAQLETHRIALTGHCYRMLGSLSEADDAVQETMVRAWKSLGQFEERASLKTWLHRIATNVCLDALSSRARRYRSFETEPVGTIDDELVVKPREHWLEPVPDAQVLPHDATPAELVVLRQSIRLAFTAALQCLPPKQRAALLLSEVLGWSAAEIADSLALSVAAVNSALQRARATLAEQGHGEELARLHAPLGDEEAQLLERYVDAFERYDVPALTALLREDAILSMPPFTMWLRGRETIAAWLLGRGSGCRGSRLIRTTASGLPALGQYRPSGPGGRHEPFALIVLEGAGSGDGFARMTSFLDTETLFPRFGLPMRLED